MAKYITKPVVIEAVAYTAGMEDGWGCYDLMGKFLGYYDKNSAYPRSNKIPAIKTSDGFCEVRAGDYIITDADGERHLCKGYIFETMYEKVEDE